MKQDYKKTTYACFIGYIVQAIVNSFVPLLFVTFQKTYQIPLTKITLLITINFVIQLLMCGGRAGTAHGFAGTFCRSVCWHFNVGHDLCSGRWIAGGAGQSDH